MILPLLTSLLILTSPLSAIKCDFHIDGNKNYICELSNATPNDQGFNHTIDGYDDANVTTVSSMIDENSALTVLDDFLMSKFPNLRKLEISFFHVEEVAAAAFETCAFIEEVSLNHNDLTDLPAGVFRNCQKLKILKLASNLFTKIPADGFDGLDGLAVLKLDNNPLVQVVADDFRHLTGLRDIFMSGTGIKSFNVSGLGSIEAVDLRNNNFVTFEVRDAPSLQSLNLSRNSLTSLRFSGPSNLTELDISMNSLHNLPASTFKDLSSLKVLKLSWNPQIYPNLSRGFFDGFRNLEVLELKSCEITDISGTSFLMLESLRELDLNHNNIQELPYMLLLGSLASLKVSSNLLEEVKPTTFMKLTSLTSLDLSHNFIRKIGGSAFKFLENLEKLDLRSNRIEILEVSMFPAGDSKLAVLDLSYNSIKAIEPGFDVQFIGADNPCIDESPSKGLDVCFKNYEELTVDTTSSTEATTQEVTEKLEFSLKDLLISLICILFIAVVLIIAVFYINGILNLFGIYEEPMVKDDAANSVAYQKF